MPDISVKTTKISVTPNNSTSPIKLAPTARMQHRENYVSLSTLQSFKLSFIVLTAHYSFNQLIPNLSLLYECSTLTSQELLRVSDNLNLSTV